jgi:Domain of unknown function (DUF5615)
MSSRRCCTPPTPLSDHAAAARDGVKFLIDNNISRRICSHLEAAGHEAVHVGALSMADADDGEILEHARGSAR